MNFPILDFKLSFNQIWWCYLGRAPSTMPRACQWMCCGTASLTWGSCLLSVFEAIVWAKLMSSNSGSWQRKCRCCLCYIGQQIRHHCLYLLLHCMIRYVNFVFWSQIAGSLLMDCNNRYSFCNWLGFCSRLKLIHSKWLLGAHSWCLHVD